MNLDWKTWKLQNQVLSIFLLQSLVLIIILLSIDIYSYQLITQIFQESSKALMVRQNSQLTGYIQYLTVKNISLIIHQSSKSVINGNYLFQYSVGLDYQYIQQPLDCLTNQENVDEYSYSSSVCYGSYGTQENSIEDYQFLNYTGLTTTILPLYQNFTFYYAQMKDNYYFAQNPGQNLTNINFHLRPWFQKYLKNNDSSLTTFCTPYLSSVGGYLIAQSTGLKYKNGTSFAIFGHPLRILNIFQSRQENMNISIVDKNGLIYSVGNQNDNQIYLSNESYTGFNLAQQTQILASLDKQQIVLYNNLLNVNVSIQAHSLQNTGLILVSQSNPLFQEELIIQRLYETSQLVYSLYQRILILWTFVTLFCILVGVITLIRILKPITDTTKILSKAILPLTSKQLLYEYLNNQDDSQLSHFQNAFRKMTGSISQSNLQISYQCTKMNQARCYATSKHTHYIWSPIFPYLNDSCAQINQNYRFNAFSTQVFIDELQRQINQIQ